MIGITLTYDKSIPVALHMVKKYGELWPNHPFVFRFAYQEFNPIIDKKIEWVKSPKEIKATIFKLIEDLDDEEWVFWCIDDKYPEQMISDDVQKLYKEIISGNLNMLDGILVSHRQIFKSSRDIEKEDRRRIGKLLFYKRKGYGNMWLHQFVKVKVLRSFFSQFPDKIAYAKDMDVLKKKIISNPSLQLYISKKNLIFFGESTSSGALTANCFESMVEKKIDTSLFKINKKQYYYIGMPIYLPFKKAYLKYLKIYLSWNFRNFFKKWK